jgi:hypothetical protein
VIWLWVRRLDSLAAERIEGSEGAVTLVRNWLAGLKK